MIIFTMKNIKFFVVALFALICATSCEQDNEGSIYTPVAQNISFNKAPQGLQEQLPQIFSVFRERADHCQVPHIFFHAYSSLLFQ